MTVHIQDIQNELADLETKGLRRTLRVIDDAQGREITLDGQKVLNFCSNDYLGLAADPEIVQAVRSSLSQEGFGAGASRLVCGNMASHQNFERAMAWFKGVERCLLFNCGYMANIGIIQALCSREDIIFCDKLNHASIIDGSLLSRAQIKRYPHNDMQALKDMLKESARYRRRLIITDSVFSMDGDCAPLVDLVDLAREYQAILMIDEAHAFGVLGAGGRGLAEELGVEKDIDIQMGTLSKAAGAFGAYCCGRDELVELILNRARSFIYTTALPSSVAAAGCRAIELIVSQPQRRQRLLANAQRVRESLKESGFDTMASTTPIIPVLVGEPDAAVNYSKQLLEDGIFVQAIRPPTVPLHSARLRITVTAQHTADDIDRLLAAMRRLKENFK